MVRSASYALPLIASGKQFSGERRVPCTVNPSCVWNIIWWEFRSKLNVGLSYIEPANLPIPNVPYTEN